MGNKFVVGSSTACEKVNTAGTDENLFRLVPVTGHGCQVLPSEIVPMPEHGAQICAEPPTKGYVQTGTHAHARARAPGTKSEQGLTFHGDVYVEFECNSAWKEFLHVSGQQIQGITFHKLQPL